MIKKIIKSDIVKSNLHVVNKVMNNNFSGLLLNEALNQVFINKFKINNLMNIFIFVRGGSQGLKNKNIKILNGNH